MTRKSGARPHVPPRLLREGVPAAALSSTLLAIGHLARLSPDYYPLIEETNILPQVRFGTNSFPRQFFSRSSELHTAACQVELAANHADQMPSPA